MDFNLTIEEMAAITLTEGLRIQEFFGWINSRPECGPDKMTLENQVTAYLSTFPMRAIPLIVALIKCGPMFGQIDKLKSFTKDEAYDSRN